jgi:hypothetical protein
MIMSRHVEVFDARDLVIEFVNDNDIPEIEEPQDRMVLWVGSVGSAMVIYGFEKLQGRPLWPTGRVL